jgi:hypothetical protein
MCYGDCAGNSATGTFLLFALVASMVGLASIFAGGHHLRVWRNESLAAAAATALIAWLLTLLAMGVACKEIHNVYGRNKRLVWMSHPSLLHCQCHPNFLLSVHLYP